MNDVAEKAGTTANVHRTVVRTLTDSEICDIARKAAEHENTARLHEREMEELKADVAEARKNAEEEIERARDYLRMVDRGTVEDDVECLEVIDTVGRRIAYVRLDTKQIIELRGMAGDQMTLDEALTAPPTAEQLAALDAYEAEHGRVLHRGAIEDQEEEE